jgi:hypothetical protein
MKNVESHRPQKVMAANRVLQRLSGQGFKTLSRGERKEELFTSWFRCAVFFNWAMKDALPFGRLSSPCR